MTEKKEKMMAEIAAAKEKRKKLRGKRHSHHAQEDDDDDSENDDSENENENDKEDSSEEDESEREEEDNNPARTKGKSTPIRHRTARSPSPILRSRRSSSDNAPPRRPRSPPPHLPGKNDRIRDLEERPRSHHSPIRSPSKTSHESAGGGAQVDRPPFDDREDEKEARRTSPSLPNEGETKPPFADTEGEEDEQDTKSPSSSSLGKTGKVPHDLLKVDFSNVKTKDPRFFTPIRSSSGNENVQ
jgi:hypothetical protein